MELTIKEVEALFKRESYNKEDIIKIMNKILSNVIKEVVINKNN